MLALYRSARHRATRSRRIGMRDESSRTFWVSSRARSWRSWSRRSCARSPSCSSGVACRIAPKQRTELRNSYKGLRPFGAADAGDFFGRDDLVADVLGRLEAGARFVCVVGASGSGKSSLVRAGVVPRLARLGTETAGSPSVLRTIEIVPGADPLVEIEAALHGMAQLLRHLGDAATSRDRLGRDQGELYRGARLEQALAWRAGHPEELNPLEGEFLDASRELRDAEQRAEEERVRHRLKQNRRPRIALVVVALALVGAVVGAVIALDQRGTANEQTDRAEAEATRATEAAAEADTERARAEEETARAETARADEASARSEAETARTEAETARFEAETGRLVAEAAARTEDDRRQAILLAAESHRRAPSFETLGALSNVLLGTGGFQGYLGSGGAYVQLEFSSDGERLVALGNGTVEVYDLPSRTLIEVFDIEEAIEASPQSGGLVASLDQRGEKAVVATTTGEVLVYSLEDDSTLATIRPDGKQVTGVAIVPNDGRIAVGHEDGTVSIWDRDGDAGPVRINANAGRVTDLAFSPDGGLVATASADPVLSDGDVPPAPADDARMWNTTTGAQVGVDLPLAPNDVQDPGAPGAGLEFSADGETLITAGPFALSRWSVPSGEVLSSAVVIPPSRMLPVLIRDFAALPGERLALAGGSGGFLVVDGARFEPVGDGVDTRLAVSGESAAIAASADGTLVALGGADGIFLWSPSGHQLLARAIPAGEQGGEAEISPLDENRLRTNPVPNLPLPPVVWDIREPNPEPVPFAPTGYFPDVSDIGGLDQDYQDRVIGDDVLQARRARSR